MESLFPSQYKDNHAMEMHHQQVMANYFALVDRLSPQDQEIAREFLRLIQERENRIKLLAYESGIQVGSRRAKLTSD